MGIFVYGFIVVYSVFASYCALNNSGTGNETKRERAHEWIRRLPDARLQEECESEPRSRMSESPSQ